MAVDDATRQRAFPALDPEPPPRPWWRRVAGVAAVVVLAVGAGAAGLAVSHRSGGTSPPPGLPPGGDAGSVLSVSVVGTLVDSAPTGGRVTARQALAAPGLRGLVSASPDHRWLLLPDGQLVAVGGARPVTVPTLLSPTPDERLGYPAFTGGDGHAVVLTEDRFGNATTTAQVMVVALATGSSAPLGEAQSAAGDPQRPGAFVALASGAPAVGQIRNPAVPDTSIELRDVGRQPVVLASAASLAGDVGLDPTTPVALDVVPDPAGSQVAVEVQDLTQPPGTGAGLVVMDRTGSVSAVEPDLSLPGGSLPAWSPDGTALAYTDQSAAGPAIEIWTVGSVVARALLPAGAPAGQCLWAPTGGAVLCAGPSGPLGRVHWTWSLTGRTGGRVTAVAGPGFPVDWYGP